MNHFRNKLAVVALALIPLAFSSCKKDEGDVVPAQSTTLTVENVLNSMPLVQSGTFQGTGTPPVVMPGDSVNIKFPAAKGEALTFASMYGWSNDLFFAPANPGIAVYNAAGMPIEGDVSAQIKLWDNGTRINQAPGAAVTHPGTADTKMITEVKGIDAQGNTYLDASALMKATLKYNGNSYFTLTLKNISGKTANATPFSPGVWALSYIAGGNLLSPAPIYTPGQASTAALTTIAETGNNAPLNTYITGQTGIFTPLSPVLVVVYTGTSNPIYKVGETDRGKGLAKLAQTGNAADLAAYLKTAPGVKSVYVLPAPSTTVLLPMIGGQPGGSVSQMLSVVPGDRIAIATMYGFSNDWFFSTMDNGVDATQKGDISSSIGLYDDGTAINQYPGAGITQFNLAGTPLTENNPVTAVANPNAFNTLPAIANMIKVTLK